MGHHVVLAFSLGFGPGWKEITHQPQSAGHDIKLPWLPWAKDYDIIGLRFYMG